MAKIFDKDNAALMSFGKAMSRMAAQPIDESEVWYDLGALEAYALTGETAYAGMKVAYVDQTNSKVYQYSIQIDGTLKEIGTAPIGDNKSIVVAEDGTVSLKGIDTLVFSRETEDGGTEEVKYQPLMTKSGLVWVEPSKTTVEGLATLIDALEAEVEAIKTEIGVKAAEDVEATGLYKEIDDAEAAAVATAVGTSVDAADANTVYGAKAYADAADAVVKSTLIGTGEDTAEADTIRGTKKYADGIKTDLIGTATDDASADTIYGAKNYAAISIDTAATPTAGYLKTYNISQHGNIIGSIDIPKDFVVTSGTVIEATEADVAIDSKVEVGKTYIKLTIANQDTPIYIAVKDLVDVYTAQENAAQVQLTISADNTISAAIVAGSIGETELSEDVKTKLNKVWDAEGAAAAVLGTESDAVDAVTVYGLKNRIDGLDTAEVAIGAGQTISSISQVDGKVILGEAQDISITHTQVSDFDDAVKAVKVDAAGSADTLTAAPVLANTDAGITVTVGGQTSEAVLVANAAKLDGQTKAEIVAEITASGVATGVTGFTTGDQVAKAIGTPGKPADEEAGTAAVAGTGVYQNVFSKEETTALIADITGGESAADVKAELTTYKTTNNARVDALELEVFGRDAEYDEDGQIVVEAVAGLDERVDALEAGHSDQAELLNGLATEIDGVETRVKALEDVGAQANVIEAITVNGEAVTVTDKTAAIVIPEYELKAATTETLGGVKSSADENKISVAADGIMEVNSVNVNKLTQTSGDVFILNGGNAAG